MYPKLTLSKSFNTIFFLFKTTKFAFTTVCPITGRIDKYDVE